MTTPTAPIRLNGRALGRAWWQLPVSMVAVLVLLAYTVAALCRVPDLGGAWPLIVGGGIGFIGMAKGEWFNQQVGAMLGERTGVTYLPADHALTRRVHALAERLDLPAPKVGVMQRLNAYASGPSRKSAVVVVGLPLVKGLTDQELDAVIGHELGHIATGDMRRMQYGGGFQKTFDGAFAVVSPTVSNAVRSTRGPIDFNTLITAAKAVTWLGQRLVGFFGNLLLMASSRNREYHADAIGAALTSPAAMIGALEKIHRADAPPTAAETDFAYLMFRGVSSNLFGTHPTLDQRRAALQDGGYIRRLPVLQPGGSVAFAG